jgi:hypothetical protein
MDHNATPSVEQEPIEFRDVEISREPFELYKILKGNVEKSRQLRSRHLAVLTYSEYAPRVKRAAALLDGLF